MEALIYKVPVDRIEAALYSLVVTQQVTRLLKIPHVLANAESVTKGFALVQQMQGHEINAYKEAYASMAQYVREIDAREEFVAAVEGGWSVLQGVVRVTDSVAQFLASGWTLQPKYEVTRKEAFDDVLLGPMCFDAFDEAVLYPGQVYVPSYFIPSLQKIQNMGERGLMLVLYLYYLRVHNDPVEVYYRESPQPQEMMLDALVLLADAEGHLANERYKGLINAAMNFVNAELLPPYGLYWIIVPVGKRWKKQLQSECPSSSLIDAGHAYATFLEELGTARFIHKYGPVKQLAEDRGRWKIIASGIFDRYKTAPPFNQDGQKSLFSQAPECLATSEETIKRYRELWSKPLDVYVAAIQQGGAQEEQTLIEREQADAALKSLEEIKKLHVSVERYKIQAEGSALSAARYLDKAREAVGQRQWGDVTKFGVYASRARDAARGLASAAREQAKKAAQIFTTMVGSKLQSEALGVLKETNQLVAEAENAADKAAANADAAIVAATRPEVEPAQLVAKKFIASAKEVYDTLVKQRDEALALLREIQDLAAPASGFAGMVAEGTMGPQEAKNEAQNILRAIYPAVQRVQALEREAAQAYQRLFNRVRNTREPYARGADEVVVAADKENTAIQNAAADAQQAWVGTNAIIGEMSIALAPPEPALEFGPAPMEVVPTAPVAPAPESGPAPMEVVPGAPEPASGPMNIGAIADRRGRRIGIERRRIVTGASSSAVVRHRDATGRLHFIVPLPEPAPPAGLLPQ